MAWYSAKKIAQGQLYLIHTSNNTVAENLNGHFAFCISELYASSKTDLWSPTRHLVLREMLHNRQGSRLRSYDHKSIHTNKKEHPF